MMMNLKFITGIIVLRLLSSNVTVTVTAAPGCDSPARARTSYSSLVVTGLSSSVTVRVTVTVLLQMPVLPVRLGDRRRLRNTQ
jgi:hypothetical protein